METHPGEEEVCEEVSKQHETHPQVGPWGVLESQRAT